MIAWKKLFFTAQTFLNKIKKIREKKCESRAEGSLPIALKYYFSYQIRSYLALIRRECKSLFLPRVAEFIYIERDN